MNMKYLLLLGFSLYSGWGEARKPFEQPYKKCVGDVCANVSIAGATHPGYYFPDIASCEDVRTQRPFFLVESPVETSPDDPRLGDKQFMQELSWVTSQAASTGCTCCHDSTLQVGYAAWDIAAEWIWTDMLTPRGVAILAGKIPSDSGGLYPTEENFGFDRSQTGIASTDPNRMRAFFEAELSRRGISDEDISKLDPFDNWLFENARKQKPVDCAVGEGVNPDGTVRWFGTPDQKPERKLARYIYILSENAPNPLVPPNLDTPEETYWRLNVRSDAPPVESGIAYGKIMEGTYQAVPVGGSAPALEPGKVYRLYVLFDVLFPITNCKFTAP